jgi:hypothetical protein
MLTSACAKRCEKHVIAGTLYSQYQWVLVRTSLIVIVTCPISESCMRCVTAVRTAGAGEYIYIHYIVYKVMCVLTSQQEVHSC